MPKKRTAENDILVPAAGAAAPLRRKTAPRTRVTPALDPAETPVAQASEEVAQVVAAAPALSSAPTYEDIARLAYSFWEARGCQGGSPEEDWRRAEEQLRSRAAAVNA